MPCVYLSVPVVTFDDESTGEMEAIADEVVLARRDFDGFYRDHHALIARVLGITLGDRTLGTEATDEAMARGYANWSTVGQYDNPAGWVYRVGLNWALSLRRKLARRLPYHEPSFVEPPAVSDPAVARALDDLDVGLRAVVVCRFLLDWSTRRTAEALGIREGTVKSRTHRALARLGSQLGHLR